MNIGERTLSLREVARVLFRYHRRGLIVFAASMALVVVALILCPRTYTSEARLFVRLGRESVNLDPTATTGAVASPHNSRESEINSVLEVLRSRSNVERVFDLIVPDAQQFSPVERERGVTGLQRNISIFAPQTSNVLVLTYEDETPELAQKTLATLLDVCLKEHLRVNRTPGSYEFFDEQAQLLTTRLDEASTALRDAKNEYGLVTLDGRRAALEQQLGNVKSQLREAEAALASSDAKTTNLQHSLDELPPALVQQHINGTPSSALGSMRQKLFELQASEQELLSKYSEAHPKVIAIRRQVLETQQILQSETPNHDEAVTAVIATELANAASVQARMKSLIQQQAELESELRQLNENELHVTQLERQVRQLDANYVHYTTGLEQARIDQALKSEGISNINIVQAPTFAPKPSQPKKALTLLIGMVVSTVGSLGTMLLSHYLDQSLKTVDEVEYKIGLPVLASIPLAQFDMERFLSQTNQEGYLSHA